MEDLNLRKITFITGNLKKLQEFQDVMKEFTDLNIDSLSIDLDEFQGTSEFIAAKKAKLAASYCENPVLVEDTSLCFNAFGGLPGPYIKEFLANLKPEGIYKMGGDWTRGFTVSKCIFAYCEDKHSDPVLFIGTCEGTIVEPKGRRYFGYESIFQPDGYEHTFGEIDQEIQGFLELIQNLGYNESESKGSEAIKRIFDY